MMEGGAGREGHRTLCSQKVPLTSVWKRAGGDSQGALYFQENGARLELWGVLSINAPWAWITMRLRSREHSIFLQRKGKVLDF